MWWFILGLVIGLTLRSEMVYMFFSVWRYTKKLRECEDKKASAQRFAYGIVNGRVSIQAKDIVEVWKKRGLL